MVEFGDAQIASIVSGDYGQNYDDYYDTETYERLSELFSIIEEPGYSPEYPEGEHNLKGALAELNKQLLDKRDPKDRSKKYKLAVARLANGMIREALNGFNNRADRMLDIAATAWGTTIFKLGKRKTPKKKSKIFTLELDVSQAKDFLNKVKEVGKVSGNKLDDKIFANHATLSAAKQAVSDVLVDIYINKNKQDGFDNTDNELKEIRAGIQYLEDCSSLLTFLKQMILRKKKEINLIRADATILIRAIQPLIFYLDNVLSQVEVLIEEINSFGRSPNKGILSSIYSQVSQLSNENRIKGIELTNSLKDIVDNKFLRTQWPDRRIMFDNNVDFKKNLFGDISYYLDKVVTKINMVLSTPFEKISSMLDSTYKAGNPYYSGSMTYGRPSVNMSSAGEAPTVDMESSRLISRNITKDKDIFEVLYSITDNLSLVFDNEQLNSFDINRIKYAIGNAIFNRPGLETEMSNFVEREIRSSWDRAIL
jgi:hypothetical protein